MNANLFQNAGAIQRSVSRQQQASGSLQEGIKQTEGKKIKGQEFVLDETKRYAEVQEDAGTIFSGVKKRYGLAATLFALAVGAPVVAAAIIGGAGAYLGGKHAKGKAKEELDKSKFFKGQTADAMTAMDKQIMQDTIYGAVSAGAGAHFQEAAKAKELATAGEGAAAAKTAVTSKVPSHEILADGTYAPTKGVDWGDSTFATKEEMWTKTGERYGAKGQKMVNWGRDLLSHEGKGHIIPKGTKPFSNLGYTAQGAWDFGGSQIKQGFTKDRSLLDWAYAGTMAKGAMK